jgi:dTDP-4-dehydrorhamnose reductase
MAKPIIAVTGAGGQLGRELQVIAKEDPLFDFLFLTREQLPIEDEKRVQEYFSEFRPAYCVNCAAYTAVDKAETEQERAFQINGKAVGFLAKACREAGTRLIHISTDYVFDGNASKPLNEEELTDPVNAYGASKLLGEKLALENNPATIVIRTAWVYSEFGNNFVNTMIRLMKERPSVKVVNDQIGTPTYAADLAHVILAILKSGHFESGLYHFTNEGRISWYEFALAIRQLTGSDCDIKPIPTSEYPTAARRPKFSLLDKSKIKRVYAISIPDWKSSLEKCIGKIMAK